MSNKKKTALFSIEIAARELVPKSLLALETAKSGMRVYIGSFRAMKQLEGKIDEFIFFHKSTWNKNAARLRKVIGAKFVFLDEEMGLAIPRSQLDHYLGARYKTVSSEDYQHSFAIGDMHKSCMESLDVFKGVKVHASGWPRIDLWREPFQRMYDKQVKLIQEDCGNYYLLITSFGAISESTYNDAIKSHLENRGDDASMVHFKYNEFKTCMQLIDELSPKLAADEKIVVRPHTCESLEEWERLLKPYANIIIHHEGDVTPWLLASKGTIQFGSTVAIQAAYMGIPSIQNQNSEKVPGLTDVTAYEILDTAKSSGEVLAFLRDSERQKPEVRQNNTINQLEGRVSNLSGTMASTQIANVLNCIKVAPQPPIHFNLPRRFILWFKEQINYLNYLKSSKLLKREHTRIKRSKFEKIPNGLKANDIGRTIRHIAQCLGDDPSRIKCRQAAHNLIEIEFD